MRWETGKKYAEKAKWQKRFPYWSILIKKKKKKKNDLLNLDKENHIPPLERQLAFLNHQTEGIPLLGEANETKILFWHNLEFCFRSNDLKVLACSAIVKRPGDLGDWKSFMQFLVFLLNWHPLIRGHLVVYKA